jgi:hydroxyacylglutathione hydrolase
MGNIIIERFATGPLETNTYVVNQEGAAACLVVDPSSGCGEVLRHIQTKKLSVAAICLTHGHFDHILGIAEIQRAQPDAGVWVHPDEKELLANAEFNGSVMIGVDFQYSGKTNNLAQGPITIGGISFEVRHVPGHSPGGCVFVFDGQCICGDCLFAGSIGRTDFPLCDGDALMRGIREKLLTLPDNTIVWPGHGNRTTIGREKRNNPFL